MPQSAENIEKTGRNFLDIFPDGGPILYIFLLFKQKRNYSIYGSFSFVVVHESSWFPRGSRAKCQKQNRSRNGQKRVVFQIFFEKSEALDPNINISISKYAPECKKYRKNGPKNSIYFSDIQPPYIFSYYLNR